jgi:hypothetical protein
MLADGEEGEVARFQVGNLVSEVLVALHRRDDEALRRQSLGDRRMSLAQCFHQIAGHCRIGNRRYRTD